MTTEPSVDQKVAVLHEFHEWRQDAGFAASHWDTAVQAYAAHLRSEERADAIEELRSLVIVRNEDGGEARFEALLDKLA